MRGQTWKTKEKSHQRETKQVFSKMKISLIQWELKDLSILKNRVFKTITITYKGQEI